jgi:hypothetical protein
MLSGIWFLNPDKYQPLFVQYAIRGFWIVANPRFALPAGMTYLLHPNLLSLI